MSKRFSTISQPRLWITGLLAGAIGRAPIAIFLVCLLVFVAVSVWAAPPAGLVVWLPGDGNLADLGSAITATSSIGTVTYGNGSIGKAFNFDGSGALVNVGGTADLDIRTAITIAAWVKPTNSGTLAIIAGRPSGYQLVLRSDGRASFGFPINGNPS